MATEDDYIKHLSVTPSIDWRLGEEIVNFYGFNGIIKPRNRNILQSVTRALIFWEHLVPEGWELELYVHRKAAYARLVHPGPEVTSIRAWSCTPAAAVTLNAMMINAQVKHEQSMKVAA